MIWRTDKPTEKVIVTKLIEDFCHMKDSYAILRLANEPYQHYCEYGEEIPYTAIEKWASLEEKKLPDGLEEAAEEFTRSEYSLPCAFGGENIEEWVSRIFIAGAEWQTEKDKEIIELAEDHAMLAGMNKMKQEMIEKAVDGRYMKAIGKVYVESWPLGIDPDSVKAGDEVRLIVLPKED